MRKQEKLDKLTYAIMHKEICRCFFTYDENYYYYYPNAVSEKLFLGQEEDDFILDGYHIRKISQLKKVEIRDDKCNEINIWQGLTDQIFLPEVDITDWKSVFESLKKLECFIIIEDEINGQFAIGLIKKVLKNKLYFQSFDADGIWAEDEWSIPYSQITTVKWGTRYADVWEKYLSHEAGGSGNNNRI